MSLVAKNHNWKINPDLSFSGRFPNGDAPPSPSSLTWTTAGVAAIAAAIAHRVTGTPLSLDVRSLALTGTNAGLAVITVSTVSGDNVVTEGWSIVTGDNLAHPGNNTGLGALELTATFSGASVKSGPISWAWQAPGGADVTAPTVPTGLTLTPQLNAMGISFNRSTDTESGVHHYDIRLGNTIVLSPSGASASVPLATVFSVGTGSVPAPTITTGATTWDIKAEGVYDVSADRGSFVGAQISGDFTLTCKLESQTTPTTNSRHGILVRKDLSAGSEMLMIYQRHSPTSPSIRTSIRSILNGSAATTATGVSTILLPYLTVQRVGNTFTTQYSDGFTTTTQTNQSLGLPTTLYVGGFVAPQVAGPENRSTFSGVSCITSSGQITTTHSTLVGGAYSVRAVDVATNASNYTVAQSAFPITTVLPKKFHPGDYVMSQAFNNTPAQIASILDSQLAGTTFEGYQQLTRYAFMQPVKNNFDFAIDYVGQCIEVCKERGRRFSLEILDRSFSGTDPGSIIPGWLLSEPNVGGAYLVKPDSVNNGVILKLWNTNTFNFYHQLLDAIAVAYDDEPYFELVNYLTEFATGLTPFYVPNTGPANDYTVAGYKAAIIEHMRRMNQAYPRTNVVIGINSEFPDADWPAFFAAMEQYRIGRCPPDIRPSDYPPVKTDPRTFGLIADKWYYGVNGPKSYVGVIPSADHIEDPDYAKYTKPPFVNLIGHQGTDGFVHTSNTYLQSTWRFWSMKNYKYNQTGPSTDEMFYSNANASSHPTNPGQPNATYRVRPYFTGFTPTINTTPPSCYGGLVDMS